MILGVFAVCLLFPGKEATSVFTLHGLSIALSSGAAMWLITSILAGLTSLCFRVFKRRLSSREFLTLYSVLLLLMAISCVAAHFSPAAAR